MDTAHTDDRAAVQDQASADEQRADAEATVWSIAPVRGALDPNALSDVLDLVEAATRADGARAFSDQSLVMLRSGSHDAVETFLAYAHAPARISAKDTAADDPSADSRGEAPETVVEHLAGVAVVTAAEGATLELVVHPLYRQQGLGRALVESAVSTLSHDGLVDAASLHAWAHGNIPAAVQLAASSGFTPVRHLVKLERPAAVPIPQPRDLPVGLRVRNFDPSRDVGPWVRLNALVFADHPEQGKITEADVRERMAETWFAPEDFLVAVNDADEIVAYNWLKRTEDEAEIYAIGVSPDAQGLGLGAHLTVAGIQRLQSEGPRPVALYTEGDNTRALSLYADTGFEQVASDVMYAVDARD